VKEKGTQGIRADKELIKIESIKSKMLDSTIGYIA